MSRLAVLSRVVLAGPIERLHRHRDAAAKREHAGGDGDAGRTEAERLERISVYARAGYFHMSYTLEMYTLVGELPHE